MEDSQVIPEPKPKERIEELYLPCFTEGYFNNKKPEEMGHFYYDIKNIEKKVNEIIHFINNRKEGE